MTTQLSNDFSGLAAERIRAAHAEIARRWLEQLRTLLPVATNEIFPSADLLDHIPALIREIADYVGGADAVAANTAIQSKAHELGELRFEQKASVHQLLREYRVLGNVIALFLQEQLDARESLHRPGEAIVALSRLNDAVFVLLQMTVDTFVGRYTERIEEQTARLEDFNRMVSHELRQPLTTVQYAVELLGSEATVDPAARARLLEIAQRNVGRLGQLVRTLGALAVPDLDNPQVQVVDVGKIVDDVCDQLAEAAAARGVVFRRETQPLALTVDVARLELVLINLISNGIKYRDPAKPEPFVEISCTAADATAQFAVRDNGLGIPEGERAHIFRRDVRAHASRDAELGNDGAGLGLAIVAECVKAMRGRIQVESVEGEGTTFTVRLPLEPSSTG
jgi:signal transduction histidine kinase